MNSQSYRFLRGGPTNWGYVLILMILTILVAGGILGYSRYIFNEMVSLTRFPEIEIKKRVVSEEITNWQIFNIEGYGISMKIPPNYTKKEEQEKRGVERLVFSGDNKERIVIVIDRSEYARSRRSELFEILKLKPEEFEEILESALDVEFISTENIEKNACVGKLYRYIEKTRKYNQTLELTSLTFENIHITIAFEYYNKQIEPKISKMIGAIECVTSIKQ